ncbi:MAG: GAF domain-containing protein, partial [Anaerolineae bacterium]|nr:GAF domain-containing protein [Anaerolineae bacterium]
VSVVSGIPVRPLIAVPLTIGGKTIGVLEAVSKRRGTFSDNDCNLIVTLANHAAVALENARLNEAYVEQLKHREQAEEALAEFNSSLEELVQQRTSHLQVLYALSEQIGLTHNIEELVRLVLDNLHRVAPHDVAASMVAKDDRVTITIRPTRPALPQVIEEMKHTLLNSFAAVTGQEAGSVGPVEVKVLDSEATSQNGREPIKSLLSIAQVPITGNLDKGGGSGVIAVAAESEDAFSTDHIQLLRSLGNQTAMFLSIRHSEQTSREREKRYRSIVENQTELISRSLPDGKLVFVNDAYCLYFGKPAEELLGHYSMPSIPGDDLVRVLRLRSSLGPDKPLISYTHRLVMPDGESRWVHWTTRAVFDETKHVIEYQAIGRDVTEEHQEAEELKIQVKYERLVSEVCSIVLHLTPETIEADITQVLRGIGEFTGSDWGFLTTLRDSCLPGNTQPRTEDVLQIQSTYEWRVEGAPSLVDCLEDCSLAKFPWWLRQLQHRDSVEVPTINGLPPEAVIEAELWRSLGIRSLVSIPLMTAGTLTGLIGLASTFADGEVISKQAALLRLSGEILTNALHGIAKQVYLEAAAREKDVLLEEVHRRVNSNMQVISSMLSRQTSQKQDPKAVAVFEEIQRPVRTTSVIHETLHSTERLASVRFDSYLETLVNDILRSFQDPPNTVSCELSIDDIDLPFDTITLCGLIVNELVSNSLEHAFAEPGERKIWVSAHLDSGAVALTVKDNGKELPADLDVARRDTLGLNLVKTLTQRLGGTMTSNGTQGTEFKIRFPI